MSECDREALVREQSTKTESRTELNVKNESEKSQLLHRQLLKSVPRRIEVVKTDLDILEQLNTVPVSFAAWS